MADSLSGMLVVITRPAHQADALCELIRASGGTTLRFPVLDITDPANPPDPAEVQALLADASLAIFISPNAVDYGMKVIESSGGLPAHIKVAAIGQGTAKKLAQHGRQANIFPSKRFDSEALLAMEELTFVADQRIVIFRGEGGREHLADILRQRGADVDYVECYKRVQPSNDNRELSSALEKKSVDAVVVTSNQGLQNLYDMLGPDDRRRLLKVQLFVVSDRTQELAQTLGFSKEAIIVDQASDQGIVESLLQWKPSDNDQY